MRRSRDFIRVRFKQLEPFYYRLDSKLRKEFARKKGGEQKPCTEPMRGVYLKIEQDKVSNVFIFLNGMNLCLSARIGPFSLAR